MTHNAGTHDLNGFAILMKFHTFENVADYIVSRYSSEHGIQFKVQFVKIQFSEQLTASLKTRLVRHLRSQFSYFDNNRRVNSTCDVNSESIKYQVILLPCQNLLKL